MEPPSSDAEALRDQQTAQVRAAHGLFVAADEFGHLERRHQPIGQPALGGQLKTGNLWTGQNRQFPGRPRPVSSTSSSPRCASRSGLWCASFVAAFQHVRVLQLLAFL